MGETVVLIAMNLRMITLIIQLIKQDDDKIEKLRERLHFKGYELVRNPLDYPMTVCCSRKLQGVPICRTDEGEANQL